MQASSQENSCDQISSGTRPEVPMQPSIFVTRSLHGSSDPSPRVELDTPETVRGGSCHDVSVEEAARYFCSYYMCFNATRPAEYHFRDRVAAPCLASCETNNIVDHSRCRCCGFWGAVLTEIGHRLASGTRRTNDDHTTRSVSRADFIIPLPSSHGYHSTTSTSSQSSEGLLEQSEYIVRHTGESGAASSNNSNTTDKYHSSGSFRGIATSSSSSLSVTNNRNPRESPLKPVSLLAMPSIEPLSPTNFKTPRGKEQQGKLKSDQPGSDLSLQFTKTPGSGARISMLSEPSSHPQLPTELSTTLPADARKAPSHISVADNNDKKTIGAATNQPTNTTNISSHAVTPCAESDFSISDAPITHSGPEVDAFEQQDVAPFLMGARSASRGRTDRAGPNQNPTSTSRLPHTAARIERPSSPSPSLYPPPPPPPAAPEWASTPSDGVVGVGRNDMRALVMPTDDDAFVPNRLGCDHSVSQFIPPTRVVRRAVYNGGLGVVEDPDQLDDFFESLNEYILLDEVGRGQYGRVLMAVHEDDADKRFAVKIVSKSKLLNKYCNDEDNKDATPRTRRGDVQRPMNITPTSEGSPKDHTFRTTPTPASPTPRSPTHHKQQQAMAIPDALEREVAVMKKLRHRNIVHLVEVIDDPDDKQLYLVMPYIESGPVLKIEDGRCTALEIDVVRAYMKQLLSAVAYLHRNQVMHCDIKPDNVLLGADGRIYLTDFGVCEIFSNGADAKHTIPDDVSRESIRQSVFRDFDVTRSQACSHEDPTADLRSAVANSNQQHHPPASVHTGVITRRRRTSPAGRMSRTSSNGLSQCVNANHHMSAAEGKRPCATLGGQWITRTREENPLSCALRGHAPSSLFSSHSNVNPSHSRNHHQNPESLVTRATTTTGTTTTMSDVCSMPSGSVLKSTSSSKMPPGDVLGASPTPGIGPFPATEPRRHLSTTSACARSTQPRKYPSNTTTRAVFVNDASVPFEVSATQSMLSALDIQTPSQNFGASTEDPPCASVADPTPAYSHASKGNRSVVKSVLADADLRHTKCTPAFAAPETMTGSVFNGAKADVWSVGVTMFVMLFGRLPFAGDTVYGVFRAISLGEVSYHVSVSAEAAAFVRRASDGASGSDDENEINDAVEAEADAGCALLAAVHSLGLPCAVGDAIQENDDESGSSAAVRCHLTTTLEVPPHSLHAMGYDDRHGLVTKYTRWACFSSYSRETQLSALAPAPPASTFSLGSPPFSAYGDFERRIPLRHMTQTKLKFFQNDTSQVSINENSD